jgi:hypothetical protein
MSEFVPPVFSKLGKSLGDLFKKKFDSGEHALKTKHKTAAGFTVESASKIKKGALCGSAKIDFCVDDIGKFTFNGCTGGNLDGQVELKHLPLNGAVVTVKGNSPNTGALEGSASVEYTQDFFAGTVAVRTPYFNGRAKKQVGSELEVGLVIGADGISVGATGTVEMVAGKDGQEPTLTDYNTRIQYQVEDVTLSLVTAKKTQNLTFGAFFQRTKDHSLGLAYDFRTAPLEKGETQQGVTIATDYRLDADTTVKAKLSGDKLCTALTHNLANPAVQIGLATDYKVNVKSLCLEKSAYGVNFTLGDY